MGENQPELQPSIQDTEETPSPAREFSLQKLDSLLTRKVDEATGITVVRFGEFDSQEGRETVERAVIWHSENNTPDFLSVWRLLGDEDNVTKVKELERKYDVRLERLEVAAYLYGLTYDFWSLHMADPATESGRERIVKKLPSIVERARNLATHEIHATHQIQDPRYIEGIRGSGVLKASSSEHYEGKGVYVGILGGYRDWGQQESTINIRLLLANALPVITDKEYPQAMAVVLSEELDISKGMKGLVETRGDIEWQNDEYYGDESSNKSEVVEWKLVQIEQILGCDVFTYLDSQWKECVYIIDTEEPPIIWASLAKALKISHAMPLSTFENQYIGDNTE